MPAGKAKRQASGLCCGFQGCVTAFQVLFSLQQSLGSTSPEYGHVMEMLHSPLTDLSWDYLRNHICTKPSPFLETNTPAELQHSLADGFQQLTAPGQALNINQTAARNGTNSAHYYIAVKAAAEQVNVNKKNTHHVVGSEPDLHKPNGTDVYADILLSHGPTSSSRELTSTGSKMWRGKYNLVSKAMHELAKSNLGFVTPTSRRSKPTLRFVKANMGELRHQLPESLHADAVVKLAEVGITISEYMRHYNAEPDCAKPAAVIGASFDSPSKAHNPAAKSPGAKGTKRKLNIDETDKDKQKSLSEENQESPPKDSQNIP